MEANDTKRIVTLWHGIDKLGDVAYFYDITNHNLPNRNQETRHFINGHHLL